MRFDYAIEKLSPIQKGCFAFYESEPAWYGRDVLITAFGYQLIISVGSGPLDRPRK